MNMIQGLKTFELYDKDIKRPSRETVPLMIKYRFKYFSMFSLCKKILCLILFITTKLTMILFKNWQLNEL
jgi:hypothetical protein